MVADTSENNPKSNGGAEKKEHTAGQFFHIGEQGEQGDASAKVEAELDAPGLLGVGHGRWLDDDAAQGAA
ncbi:unnamed protein product [Closterium sp. NIES-53]